MTLTRILLRCVLPLFTLSLGALCQRTPAAPQSERVAVAGDAPAAVPTARSAGRLPAATQISVALTLPLRNRAALEDLLGRLQDPTDPDYHHYLTPAQFAARFSPTEADYAAVAAFARAQGLTVTGTHANRLLLDVAGAAGAVETALNIHLNHYQAADGRLFRAPDAAPSVPRALAGRLTGVAGLSDMAVRHPHSVRATAEGFLRPDLAGRRVGSGPGGGLTPADIKTAYSLSGVSLDGTGQTLALFEQDGYNASDISAYESQFGLRSVPLQNVLLDGASGAAGTNADEVTLDIELQIAMAPGASKILVYETGSSDSDVLDAYSRIADDNLAKQVSTSWGLDEPESAPSTLQAENTIFQQMAAQGQTFYAASGDNGAYDTGSRSGGLSVDDPASQPYVCGVGGTTLTTSAAGGPYSSETTWNGRSVANGAGGGGISTVWQIPTWQVAAVTSASGGSTAMRNVPDVSLDANPNAGYAIYVGGGWQVYGGTSCAAPLWAGFTALVNQQRAAGGLSPLGQANPTLYPLLASARYAADFHDIADGSTNLYYPAVTGYDDATGLGTLNGAGLLADLAPTVTAHTHLLWNNSDGRVMLWSIAPSGSFTLNGFGPYTDGAPQNVWHATAIATGTDGRSHLLWNNTDGRVMLWTVDDLGNFTLAGYGPYTDNAPGNLWSATSVSVGPDNIVHLLWNNTDNRVMLWNVASDFTFTLAGYGPYTDNAPGNLWSATAIATGSDNKTRIVWNNTDHRIMLWNVDSGFNFTLAGYGPYTDGASQNLWSAVGVSAGPNGTAHLLWSNTDRRAMFWNVNPDFSFALAGFGPYTDNAPTNLWTASALATGPDGASHILWNNTDYRAMLWGVDNSFNYTVAGYGPYTDNAPGNQWSVTAVSAGP